jgi:hypothetical protein
MHLLISLINTTKNLNTAVPISKCDENLERAHLRNAVTDAKFWWPESLTQSDTQSYLEMSLSEILNGSEDHEGLFTLLKAHV